MRISDWSSDVCSSDLPAVQRRLDAHIATVDRLPPAGSPEEYSALFEAAYPAEKDRQTFIASMIAGAKLAYGHLALAAMLKAGHNNLIWTTNFDHLLRSEEHTSELQSLMRISYAVFCLKKKKKKKQ